MSHSATDTDAVMQITVSGTASPVLAEFADQLGTTPEDVTELVQLALARWIDPRLLDHHAHEIFSV